jgi:antitoxin component of RelBE/YafQ-DinJ toxin-antitoxin module
MTQTKTVSTRIDNNVHNLFTDYCNHQGVTMSQMLNQFVNDVVTQNKDLIDSSQCSIDSDEEKEPTKPQIFSQVTPLEEEMKSLQNKNIRVMMVQELNQDFAKHIDELKQAIQKLNTRFDKKLEEDNMKNLMAHFNNHSSFY